MGRVNPQRVHCIVLAGLVTATALLALSPSYAQSPDASESNAASPFGPSMHDNRLYTHLLFDELEGRLGSTDSFRWDGEGWIGTDTNRLWIKSEGFATHGGVEDGVQELFYDRPISPFFDVQGGVRYDLDSLPGRGWAALGVQGLAPYLFELSATLYARDAGHLAARLQASYDELLTQRLILQPLVEINAYTRPDRVRDVGSGLSDIDAGLRLRYEINRKFAPYLGVTYQRSYGPRSRSAGVAPSGSVDTWRLAIGMRTWL